MIPEVLFAAAILASSLAFILIKQEGAFFVPSVSEENFPEDQRPLLKMNKGKLLTITKPRHTLLPLLKKIAEGDWKAANIDLISYNFSYGGYNPNDQWYRALKEITKKGGKVNLLGGKPPDEETCKNIMSLDANLRFLAVPPTTHIFVYSRESKPAFIWFESWHEDDKAIGVAYTESPCEYDANKAEEFFNNLWEKGIQPTCAQY
jgi:hypothetical protein